MSQLKSSPTERIVAKSFLKSKTKSKLSFFKDRFKTLPLKKQIALSAIFIFLIIIVGTTSTYIYQSARKKQIAEFNEITTKIIQLQEEAEAKQIYNADDEARAQLLEGRHLLSLIKTKTRVQKDKKNQLEEMINSSLINLRKEIIIQPALLAGISEETLAKPRYLENTNEKIIVTGAHTARAIIIQKDSVTIKEIATPEPLTNPYFDNENNLFWQSGNKLFVINEDDSITEKFDQLNHAIDYMVYNRRLYLLQPEQNQITTNAPSAGGFASYTKNWITEETVFPLESQFLAVDGDLYIFNNTGSVQKFNRGKSVSFNLKLIDPLLENVNQVWTNDFSDFLYILDSKFGRLVVFDKHGKLAAQYKSDLLKNATDFATDEPNKQIFIITDRGVMSFKIDHIKNTE